MNGYLILTIEMIVMCCSFCGISMFLYDKMKCNVCFIPIITISSITGIIFLAGLLNVLAYATYLVIILGLVHFVYCILKIKQKKMDINEFHCYGIYVFVILNLYFIWYLKDAVYVHIDNFSHWGVIVKEMLYFDALPDSRTIVTFQNYPPATATFIYYICKIIGYSEGKTLIVQSIIISASLTTLFCKVTTRISAISMLFISIISFSAIYNPHLSTLLVDTVLGYLVVAGIVILYYYYPNIKRALFCAVPVLIMILLTKDSGKLFLVFIVSVLIIITLGNRKRVDFKKNLLYLVGVSTSLMLVDMLWNAYVEKSYLSESIASGEGFELYNLFRSIENKSSTFLNELPQLFIEHLFRFHHMTVKIIIVSGVLFIILLLVLKVLAIRDNKKKWLEETSIKELVNGNIILNVLLIYYIVGMFVMYATLMHEHIDVDNSYYLPSFDRYFSTVVVIYFLIQMFFIINSMQQNIFAYHKVKIFCYSCIWLAFILLCWKSPLLQKHNVDDEIRTIEIQELFQSIADNISRNESVILLVDEGANTHYLSPYLRYEILSRNIKVLECAQIEEYTTNKIYDEFMGFHYLIVASDPYEIKEVLEGKGVELMEVGEVYAIHNDDELILTVQSY